LNNLESIKPLIEVKVKDFTFDTDSCHFKVDPVGNVGVRLVERDPFKSIKLESLKSRLQFIGLIQLQPEGPEESSLKLSFSADIPFFLKAMISNKLEEGIKNMAEMLAKLPY
ncbi:MAG: SRPBCC family protein, partial [Bacteroidia bacterium]|nr:SRPBCC family protein [Bacteroidia bacterium]